MLNFLSIARNSLFRRQGRARGRIPGLSELELLEARRLLTDFPQLVADLNSTPAISYFSERPVEAGGILFFVATSPVTGTELWKTDGTTAGTVLVKDIDSRPATSYTVYSSNPQSLTNVAGTLYFTADDGVHGRELWKSDGTAAGTVMVKDILISAYGDGSQPRSLTSVGNTLFFAADDGTHGVELWKSDGTAAGTIQVRDINPSAATGSYPFYLTDVAGTLFFSANDGVHGTELWRSDGTTFGTELVIDATPGSASSYPAQFTSQGGKLYYTNSFTSWLSDGTAEGTMSFADYLGIDTNEFGQVGRPLLIDQTLYFAARGQLWKSDLQAPGPQLVSEINPGIISTPTQLTNVAGRLYFLAYDGNTGEGLWTSDGSAAGTQLLLPSTAGTVPDSAISNLTALGDTLFFTFATNAAGRELWASDGTVEGTRLVRDISPGSSNSYINNLTVTGSDLIFTASIGGITGLWQSDGTEESTVLIQDTFGTADANPQGLINLDGTLFFQLPQPDTGAAFDLWTTDGTDAGTTFVSAFLGGAASNYPSTPVVLGDTLLFVAYRFETGYELWRTDGTAAGTAIVKDIYSNSSSIFANQSSWPGDLTYFNGAVYFAATSDGNSNRELWKSDGTEAGTVLVKDILPGSSGSFPEELTRAGNKLYFTAGNGNFGRNLWQTDGTAAGTVLLKSFGQPDASAQPFGLTNVGGTLYFFTETFGAVNTRQLWKSDGTEAGTTLVKVLSSTADQLPRPGGIVSAGGRLFFTCDDGVHGTELWTSDGTAAGTRLVNDIQAGSGSSNPANLLLSGNSLFFTADDGTHGVELWTSDGTPEGTRLIRDINPGSAASLPGALAQAGGVVYFAADDGSTGRELWRSDGTAAGTWLVADLAIALPQGSLPDSLTVINDQLYFAASDDIHGRELWRLPVAADVVNHNPEFTSTATPSVPENTTSVVTIGVIDEDLPPQTITLSITGGADQSDFTITPAGLLVFNFSPDYEHPQDADHDNVYLVQIAADDGQGGRTIQNLSVAVADVQDQPLVTAQFVKDLNPGSEDSSPYGFAVVGGTLFFTAETPATGIELWKSDGTAAGTTLVKDVNPGSSTSYITSLTSFGSQLLFRANDGVHGSELWKSDGTAAGTTLVKDINPGSGDALPFVSTPIVFGGLLYFSANDGVHGFELWKSDGTAAGTALVKDLNPGMNGSSPYELTVFNGALYFSATGAEGTELWKTDGTAAGTVLVKDIQQGTGDSIPFDLTVFGSELFFVADDGVHGAELWKSDGTAGGTLLVADLETGSYGSYPDNLTIVNDMLFLTTGDWLSGPSSLWKSDGTAAGTTLMKSFDRHTGNVSQLTSAAAQLFFTANDGSNGSELWKSDGTPDGTRLVLDIQPGFPSSAPSDLTSFGDLLLFSAGDGIHGFELWQTNGNPAETVMAADLNPEGNSAPGPFIHFNNTLYFAASDANHGREFWRLGETTEDQNHPPQIISTDSPSIPEGSTNVLTVVAIDSDLPAQTITWSITGGADQAFFAITSDGVLSFLTAPDFESPLDADGNNIYLVEVTANDGAGGLTSQVLEVTVTGLDDSLPTLHFNSPAATWIKKQPPVTPFDNAVVDGPPVDHGAVLLINMDSAGKKKSVDSLQIPGISSIGTSSGGLKFVNHQLVLEVSLNSNVSAAAIQAFLRGIKFSTKGSGFKVPSRTIHASLQQNGTIVSSIQQTINVRKSARQG